MPQVPPSAPGLAAPRRKPVNWLGWGLAAFILASCIFFIDPSSIGHVLRRLSPVEITVLVVISTLDRVLMGVKWNVLLRIVGVRLPLARVVAIFYQASFTGVFLPSHIGGDLLRAYWVARESGRGAPPVLASLVMERLLGLLSAVNWALLGGVLLAVHLAPAHAWTLIGLGVLAAVAANVLFVFSLTDRVHGWVLRGLGRFGRLRFIGVLERFYTAYAGYSRDRRGLLLSAALTLLEHSLQMVLIVAIALSIDLPAGPFALIAAAALYLLLVRLPLAPDGWGIGEISAIGVLGLVGVGAADAFSLSLISHVVPMLALAPGLLFLLTGQGRPPVPAAADESLLQPAAPPARPESSDEQLILLSRRGAPVPH